VIRSPGAGAVLALTLWRTPWRPLPRPRTMAERPESPP